jgi:hypothetical protein
MVRSDQAEIGPAGLVGTPPRGEVNSPLQHRTELCRAVPRLDVEAALRPGARSSGAQGAATRRGKLAATAPNGAGSLGPLRNLIRWRVRGQPDPTPRALTKKWAFAHCVRSPIKV